MPTRDHLLAWIGTVKRIRENLPSKAHSFDIGNLGEIQKYLEWKMEILRKEGTWSDKEKLPFEE